MVVKASRQKGARGFVLVLALLLLLVVAMIGVSAIDTSTFENPRQFARGLDWVFVNGVPLIEDGKLQERLPGKVITRG